MAKLTLDVYRDYSPAGKEAGLLPLVEGARVLEIGFGGAKLLEALRAQGNEVHGVDASESLVQEAREKGFEQVHVVDISDSPLPYDDDTFDAVYAYEVFEHLTNPHRMFAEVRRVLRKDGLLFFSVPAQEIDMGYGPNRHTFVYPGLLEKKNLERFIMQMYFRIEHQIEPGPRDHLVGHNYILRNMKSADKADVVEVIIGNYNVRELYGYLLSEEQLAREIETEIAPYLVQIRQLAEVQQWPLALHLLKMLLAEYPECQMLYVRLVELLLDAPDWPRGRQIAESIAAGAPRLSAERRKRLKALLATETVQAT